MTCPAALSVAPPVAIATGDFTTTRGSDQPRIFGAGCWYTVRIGILAIATPQVGPGSQVPRV